MVGGGLISQAMASGDRVLGQGLITSAMCTKIKTYEEIGFGNLYIRQVVYTSFDIGLGCALEEKGTQYQYCARWVLLDKNGELICKDNMNYQFVKYNIPSGTYTLKIVYTPFKPVKGYEQQVKIKPNETTNFDVLFTFRTCIITWELLNYDPYNISENKYYYYRYIGALNEIDEATWGDYLQYGVKETICIDNEIVEDIYILQSLNEMTFLQNSTFDGLSIQGSNVMPCDGGGSMPVLFTWKGDGDKSNPGKLLVAGTCKLNMSSLPTLADIINKRIYLSFSTELTVTDLSSVNSTYSVADTNYGDHLTVNVNELPGDVGIKWFSLVPTEWWDLYDTTNYNAWIQAGNGYFIEKGERNDYGSPGDSLIFRPTPRGVSRSLDDKNYYVKPLKRISIEKANLCMNELRKIAPLALRFDNANQNNYYAFQAVPYSRSYSTYSGFLKNMRPYAYLYKDGEPIDTVMNRDYNFGIDENIEKHFYLYSYDYISSDYFKYF